MKILKISRMYDFEVPLMVNDLTKRYTIITYEPTTTNLVAHANRFLIPIKKIYVHPQSNDIFFIRSNDENWYKIKCYLSDFFIDKKIVLD